MEKILFCVFAVFVFVMPAIADVTPNTKVVTRSYVEGAYNSMDSVKHDKLTSTNVVESGSGAVVSAVAANNGTVTVTKSEVMIPVGGQTSSSHAHIWIQ